MSKQRLLFITTGGTIASVRTAQGLKPVLTSEELLECGQAHHPHGCPAAHFQRDHRCKEEPAGQRDLCP